ncbi:MAG: 1,6-anhydro-N-acetylmuramyl-L-alanine amidase AmpD [Arenicellales bacterium WSBS_2016_MAG_OTU3]
MLLDKTTGLVLPLRFCASPNYDDRPDANDVYLIVVHAISLPPEQFGGCEVESFFCNRLDHDADDYFDDIRETKVSAHFFIRRTGACCQFVPITKRAWHAGQSVYAGRERVNDFSIGVELEGSDKQPFTMPQFRSLALLSNCLIGELPLLLKENIVGHSDIAPNRKTDPGPFFDWVFFSALLD